ncbi:MAG: von Willebrand factor type [Acidobacteria bacterium]|nr:von Willebrand factor type [Acidobacteriota bacterium]
MTTIDVEFAMNPDPRCACVLLLDTSASMAGPPINELNQSLKVFQEDLQEDPLARRRVEIAVVTFGDKGVTKIQDFVPVTCMGVDSRGEPVGVANEFSADQSRLTA